MTVIRVVVLHYLVRPLLRIVFGIATEGKEHLADLSQFLIAANHNSHLDVFLVCSLLTRNQLKKTTPVAARDYFSKSRLLFRLVDSLLNPIWIDRENGRVAFESILDRIDAGYNIIIFPEGTRGEPGHIQEFKTGIGRLLEARPSVPVVPVFLRGPERSFPRETKIPLPLWNRIVVAHPQRFSGDPSVATATLKTAIEQMESFYDAKKHKRSPTRTPARMIAILGIDGSGKSTLSKRLAIRLSSGNTTCLIGDSLELFVDLNTKAMQPLLTETARKWLGGLAKQAKSLARYKIPKLAELLLRDRLLEEADRWYRPATTVMDGCPLLNMTAWAALYREEHFNMEFCAKAITLMSSTGVATQDNDPLFRRFPELKYLKRFGFNRLHLPDVVVFLDVDPKVAMSRIENRGERKQVHETVEKLGKLREAYLLVCKTLRQNGREDVHRVDGDKGLEELTEQVLALVNPGGIGN